MGQYLIDNNAISKYFSNFFTEKGMDFVADVLDQSPNISVITQIEALSWVNPDKSKEKVVQEFIQDVNVIGLNDEIVTKCVRIRRMRKIKTPDAIIAATAIVNNFILITSDGDFNNIDELQTIDPEGM